MSGDNWEIYKLEYVVNQGVNAVKYVYVSLTILPYINHITSCLILKKTILHILRLTPLRWHITMEMTY